MSKYFEDFIIGETFRSPSKTVTESAITMMIALAGFTVPLFNDEEYAKKTSFGSRIAPGRMILFFMGDWRNSLGFMMKLLLLWLDWIKYGLRRLLDRGILFMLILR